MSDGCRHGLYSVDVCDICSAEMALERMEQKVAEALDWLRPIGPPSHSCCGDPVCAEHPDWGPRTSEWCDSCLANAARGALEGR